MEFQKQCSFDQCKANDFLPLTCSQCFFYFCEQHSSPFNHDCKHDPHASSNVLSNDQDRACLEKLVDLFLTKCINNATKGKEYQRIKRDAKALQCLGNVVGGMDLLARFNWWEIFENGEAYLALGGKEGAENRIDVSANLKAMKEEFLEMKQCLQRNGKSEPQKLAYCLVLDFEANCLENERIKPQEIIEFPCVLLNLSTLRVESEFHRYVKPEKHPKISQFCTELTGITQETVDGGVSLKQCFAEFEEWLFKNKLLQHTNGKMVKTCAWTFVSCGDWDLKTCLPQNIELLNKSIPAYFDDWVNIKKAFVKLYKGFKGGSMTKMLESLKMNLIGRHHSGIDDTRNICRILIRMLQDGYRVEITSWREIGYGKKPKKKK